MKIKTCPWLLKARKYGEELKYEVNSIPKMYPEVLTIKSKSSNKDNLGSYQHQLGQLDCWRRDILWPILLGDILLSTGDKEGALEKYKRCLPLEKMTATYPIIADPGGHVALRGGIHLYQKLLEFGDKESAQSALQTLVNPKYRALSEISYVYLQIGDLEKAKEHLENAFTMKQKDEFGYDLNWLATQLGHRKIMKATLQEKLQSTTNPFTRYHLLKENSEDVTSHLRALLTEAEKKEAYDTAFVAATLLEDQDECKRLIKLEKEKASKDRESISLRTQRENISLYSIDDIHPLLKIEDYDLLLILLKNDYFRKKFQSQVELIANPRSSYAVDTYFLLGSREGVEQSLVAGELKSLKRIKNLKQEHDTLLKLSESSSIESLGDKHERSQQRMDMIETFQHKLLCHENLTQMCFDGYKKLERLQEGYQTSSRH